MKTIFIAIAILLLVNLSTQQQDPDATTVDPTTTTTDESHLVNLNDFLELRKTICGCDGNIATSCLQTPVQNETNLDISKRIVRSIETPLSDLWAKLKSMANLIQSTQVQQEQQQDGGAQKQQKVEQQQQPSCQSVTQIKCADAKQRIQVIKTDVTNIDSSVCPVSTLSVDPEQSVCTSNRIKSTELAQKLCNDKNECSLSLSQDGFETICGCTTQKYLDLIYMCVNQNDEQENQQNSKRSKRQVGRRGRAGYGLGGRLGALGYTGLGYGGLGYGGLGYGQLIEYGLMSGYGVGFPRYGINSGFRLVGGQGGEGRLRGEGRLGEGRLGEGRLGEGRLGEGKK